MAAPLPAFWGWRMRDRSSATRGAMMSQVLSVLASSTTMISFSGEEARTRAMVSAMVPCSLYTGMMTESFTLESCVVGVWDSIRRD